VSIKAGQAVIRTEPNKTLFVLNNGIYMVLGQTIGCVVSFEVEII